MEDIGKRCLQKNKYCKINFINLLIEIFPLILQQSQRCDSKAQSPVLDVRTS